MEKYTLDPFAFSLEKFYEITRSRKMIPSRVPLKENMEEQFQLLENQGIENLGLLISALDSKDKIMNMVSATGIPENYLVLLKREAGSYLAKPVPLSDLLGVPFEFTEVLKSRSIKNTRDFFEAVQTSGQRKEMSETTGIPENRLQEIFSLCDLTRITGVGALYSRIIYDSGIRSTRDFADTDVSFHVAKYKEVIEKYGYKVESLAEDDIQYCIDYARVTWKRALKQNEYEECFLYRDTAPDAPAPVPYSSGRAA